MRHHLHNGPRHCRRVGFRVLAARDDRVEEFAAGAQLHDEVHVVPVLERARDGHNLVAPFEVVHDLHLAADVADVRRGRQLALRDRFARQLPARGAFFRQPRGAKLAFAEDAAKGVELGDVLGSEGRGGGVGWGGRHGVPAAAAPRRRLALLPPPSQHPTSVGVPRTPAADLRALAAWGIGEARRHAAAGGQIGKRRPCMSLKTRWRHDGPMPTGERGWRAPGAPQPPPPAPRHATSARAPRPSWVQTRRCPWWAAGWGVGRGGW